MGSDGVGKEGGVGKGTNYNTCMFRRSWGGGVAPSAAGVGLVTTGIYVVGWKIPYIVVFD